MLIAFFNFSFALQSYLMLKLNKEQRLTAAILLGTIFLVAELIGGIISNSLAVIADAAHLFTDVFGFVIALLAVKLSKTKATSQFTFGFARVEVFSALFSLLLLWGVTIWLVVEAVQRAIDWAHDRAEEINGPLMFGVACFGIFVNLCLGVVFHEDHGGPLSGHSHDHEDLEHEPEESVNYLHRKSLGSQSYVSVSVSDKDQVNNEANENKIITNEKKKKLLYIPPKKKLSASFSANSASVSSSFSGDIHDHSHSHSEGDHSPVQEEVNLSPEIDSSICHFCEKDADKDLLEPLNVTNAERISILSPPSSFSTQPPSATIAKFNQRRKQRSTCTHDHSHGHISSEDVNMQAAFLHVLTDLVQSIGVAIGGAIIWKEPSWQIADVICTIIFSILVLISTKSVAIRVFNILLEGTPEKVNINQLYRNLRGIESVIDVHDLHVWNLSSTSIVLTCHIVTNSSNSDLVCVRAHEVCDAAGVDHATIQVQRTKRKEGADCYASSCKVDGLKFRCHHHDSLHVMEV